MKEWIRIQSFPILKRLYKETSVGLKRAEESSGEEDGSAACLNGPDAP